MRSGLSSLWRCRLESSRPTDSLFDLYTSTLWQLVRLRVLFSRFLLFYRETASLKRSPPFFFLSKAIVASLFALVIRNDSVHDSISPEQKGRDLADLEKQEQEAPTREG